MSARQRRVTPAPRGKSPRQIERSPNHDRPGPLALATTTTTNSLDVRPAIHNLLAGGHVDDLTQAAATS
jgi:hypothetical protein